MTNPIQAVVEQIGRDVGEINRKIESLGTTSGGIEIVDNLTSDDTDKALSAKQGKELKKALDGKVNLRGQNDIHGSTAFFAQIFGMGGIRIAANARYNNQGHYAVMGANNNDAWWQFNGGGTVRIHKGDRLSFNNQTIYHEGNLPAASDDSAGVVTLATIKELIQTLATTTGDSSMTEEQIEQYLVALNDKITQQKELLAQQREVHRQLEATNQSIREERAKANALNTVLDMGHFSEFRNIMVVSPKTFTSQYTANSAVSRYMNNMAATAGSGASINSSQYRLYAVHNNGLALIWQGVGNQLPSSLSSRIVNENSQKPLAIILMQ